MLVNLVKKLNRACTSDILWQAILGRCNLEFEVLWSGSHWKW
jgi:hypothetical protein